ncbi:LysM peptidoglycan-binding domain-containing protein [Kribbella sp. CA-293567]|uniref:LysM peptidoglycan-binding domain-containing protein n=1 Tax=Kribbella sp. CA-293567 TaxID=3002436 RepID=UPI0022DD8A87|nr:LysM peptidoglycan-binding domain-containing protein [Kribbella sp. CA-293567]WBQ03931.1 LysM peptidoglycan-binding domain-containing protein [Kribbella sp. CA-293567]
MNATIRGLKGLLALSALAVLGLLLRWVTSGSIAAATTHDLTSMASLTIGAVAWVAYGWLVVAVLATVLEQAPGALGRGASVVATRITSQGSRALLRSALGVAAVTPLTVGIAQATPGDGPYRDTEPRSTVQLTGDSTAAGIRPWTSVEPRSRISLTGEARTAGRSSAPQPASPQTQTTRATRGGAEVRSAPAAQISPSGARPWSAVEPRSTVEIGGAPDSFSHSRSSESRPAEDSPADWRATEKPSSIEVTGEGAEKPPVASSHSRSSGSLPAEDSPAGRPAAEKPSYIEVTGEAIEKPPVSSTRTGGEPRTPPASGKPVQKRPSGPVAVPDRPTAGAPTRYTHLQSGRLTRSASHLVKQGDSLWSIAAAELGPTATDEAIAARWPQWYAANRHLIGPTPDLIHPGQVLTAPAPVHPVPPTHQEK